MVKSVTIAKTLKGQLNFNRITEGSTPIVSIHQFKIFFLLTTIDLIDVFCRQSVIGIDRINVFLTIGGHYDDCYCSKLNTTDDSCRQLLF